MNRYFEAHITIEPLFDDELNDLKKLAATFKFKVADLLIKTHRKDTLERSSLDSFLTGHGGDLPDLMLRTEQLLNMLHCYGFKVWRYKIEDILIDSKLCDTWKLVNKEQGLVNLEKS